MKDTFASAGGFAAGVLVGVGVAAVAALAIGAVRRARFSHTEHQHLIDGVHPPRDVELAAAPAREANAFPRRLESESLDAPTTSQRW
jgi:hypothetical protein